MTDKVFEYKSAQKIIWCELDVLETIDAEGIVCVWAAHRGSKDVDSDEYTFYLTWYFDWTTLKEQGVETLSGYLIVNSVYPDYFPTEKVDINWEEGNEKIFKYVESQYQRVDACFEYHLTAHYAEIPESKKVSHEEMFAASDLNDVVLVVEGKKLHVNKVFLSIHSEFFRALFSSKFKEGEMSEIPIEDVSSEDFGLLMSTIYPDTVFPNDRTAEKLLELADRFLMRAVIRQVEHHLLEHSKLSNEKMTWMADAYGMPTLLEKCIQSMDTVEKVKSLKKSEEFNKLSPQTSQMLLNRLLQLV